MAEEKNSIFRQKSIEQISSPEQLTDYLRVTNPGIWSLLAAIIILLGGLFAWSIAGRLETDADSVAVVQQGQAMIMLKDASNAGLEAGMPVRIGEDEYIISSVKKDEYGRTIAYAPIDKADGQYDVKVVTESVHPIKFLFS